MQIWREIRFKFQRTLVVAELIVYVCTLIGSKWKLLFNLIEKKNFIRVASKDLIRPMNEKVQDPSAADWKCRRIR